MPAIANEAAYCTRRIARSTELALASTDICARLSHAGIAAAYGKRLASLAAPGTSANLPTSSVLIGTGLVPQTDGTLPRPRAPTFDNGASALPADDGPTLTVGHAVEHDMADGEIAQLKARLVALENVTVAMLAGASNDQRAVIHDMALFARPLVSKVGDGTTIDTADLMDRLATRAALVARVQA